MGKAMEILLSFTAIRLRQSLRQIEERTGIPRTTAHGICLALVDAEMLEVVPQRGYQLGPAFIGLGGQVIERTGLLDAAKDVGKRLIHLDNTEAHLGQLVGGWIVYLDRTASNFKLPMNIRMGSRTLAHTTVCGRAALAQLRPEETWRHVQAACRSEGKDDPNRFELFDQLMAIRHRGYDIQVDTKSARTSVGSAIISVGSPVGGVSVSAPSTLFADRDSAEKIVRTLHMIATTISRRLLPAP